MKQFYIQMSGENIVRYLLIVWCTMFPLLGIDLRKLTLLILMKIIIFHAKEYGIEPPYVPCSTIQKVWHKGPFIQITNL